MSELKLIGAIVGFFGTLIVSMIGYYIRERKIDSERERRDMKAEIKAHRKIYVGIEKTLAKLVEVAEEGKKDRANIWQELKDMRNGS